MRDYRDLTIEDLADENFRLRQSVAAYRALLCAALDKLADLATDNRRQRDVHERLIDENRALREQFLRSAA